MATQQDLDQIAHSILRAANTDPTFIPMRLEMRRFADKIKSLTPVEPQEKPAIYTGV